VIELTDANYKFKTARHILYLADLVLPGFCPLKPMDFG
jgi:hypothetical protein